MGDCTRGNGCCVAGDTQILTDCGMARIDWLYSCHAKGTRMRVLAIVGGQMGAVEVVRVHRDEPKELLFVGLSEGVTIKLTPYHPVLLKGAYLRADALREGDIISGHMIRCIRKADKLETVYDLELRGGANNYNANSLTVMSYNTAEAG